MMKYEGATLSLSEAHLFILVHHLQVKFVVVYHMCSDRIINFTYL